MEHVLVTFERVDQIQRIASSLTTAKHTLFSFAANGREFQDIAVPGWPNLESGMRVMAVLHEKGNWQSLVGWVNLGSGELAAPSPQAALQRAVGVLTFFLLFVLSVWCALGPKLPVGGLLLLALGLLLQAYLTHSLAQWLRQHIVAREISHLRPQPEG